MLKSIYIENFKSYKTQELPLSPLTLMIGANAAGKSNALEAFRFLSWLSQGQKLSVLKHRVDDSEEVLRGQVSNLGFLESPTFKLGCKTDDRQDWNEFKVEIAIRDGELHVIQESITSPKESFPLYRVEQTSTGLSTDIRVSYNNFARGGKKPQITCTDQIAVMCQLASSALFESGHKKAQLEIPKATDKFQNMLSSTLFLDPIPSLMRVESYAESKLRGDCKNLSGVLYTLWQKEESRPVILDFIRSLPEQEVDSIDFLEDRRGRWALELTETFGGVQRKWPVEVLSDGTLRVLAIAAALLSAPIGSTVVIEEVDNGIHPSRAKKLLRTMREQAEARKIHLLLTTHNPALMDAIPDESLCDVVFCYRDRIDGDSRLTRLSDLEDYASLVSQGPLGDLITNGIIDRFVKNPITTEEKKNNAREWLRKMQSGSHQ